MLKIGDFSKLSRISIRMLRHYDEIGLLIPESTDEWTGYRYYSEAQLPLANRITSLKNMGFCLADIRNIMSECRDPERFKSCLLAKQTELMEQADSLQEKLHFLETTLKRLGKDDMIMEYNVTLKELAERTVASVRKIIPSYDQEGALWKILMEETAPLSVRNANPCYTLAIFHDREHKEKDVDVEIQKNVSGSYPNTEHVVFKREAPIQMASATYKGSYDLITEVNEAVANWVADNGYEFDGPSFCIYHVSPHETKNPDELVTEVCYPVKKK